MTYDKLAIVTNSQTATMFRFPHDVTSAGFAERRGLRLRHRRHRVNQQLIYCRRSLPGLGEPRGIVADGETPNHNRTADYENGFLIRDGRAVRLVFVGEETVGSRTLPTADVKSVGREKLSGPTPDVQTSSSTRRGEQLLFAIPRKKHNVRVKIN